MADQCWLECIQGCGTRYSVFDVVYYCDQCGGLLEVKHDLKTLKERSASSWKTLFERRNNFSRSPYHSGVWGKKEWVMPPVKEDQIITLSEGLTPLFQASKLGEPLGVPGLWVKLSGNSHTGSFKDLGMTVLVSVVKQMIADGKPIRAIAAASTGDTSAALAAYAAAAGIPAVILLPKGKISPAQLIQPIANGALVLALDDDFDGCMKVVRELTEDSEIYLANSLNSLRIEGQKTVGIEIVQQLGWQVPDWVIIPAGNLGNVSALGSGLAMMKELGLIERLPRIACAQAANANPLYLSYQTSFEEYHPVEAKKTAASAIQIGAPVSYPRAVKVLKEYHGIVDQASEKELADAAAWADQAGLYTCPQTGVALAVFQKMVQRGEIKEGDQVVIISTAHGLKFTEFKLDYHLQRDAEIQGKYVNQLIEVPGDLASVKQAIRGAS